MASIPLRLQKGSNNGGPPNSFPTGFERGPKRKSLKRTISSRRQPAKANERLAGLRGRVSSLHQRYERETDEAPHSAKGVNGTDDQVNRIVEHLCVHIASDNPIEGRAVRSLSAERQGILASIILL